MSFEYCSNTKFANGYEYPDLTNSEINLSSKYLSLPLSFIP